MAAPLPGAAVSGLNRVAGQLGGFDIIWRELQENCFLIRGGRRIDALIDRRAEFVGEVA